MIWEKPFEYNDSQIITEMHRYNLHCTDFLIATENGWRDVITGQVFEVGCVYKLKPWTEQRIIDWLVSNKTVRVFCWPPEIYALASKIEGSAFNVLGHSKKFFFNQLSSNSIASLDNTKHSLQSTNYLIRIFCDSNDAHRFSYNGTPFTVTNAPSIKGFLGYWKVGQMDIDRVFNESHEFVVFKEK